MPSTDNRLKVCTFNAKCDDLDDKCCKVDHCYSSENSGVPASLKAVMLSITLLPHRASVFNLQNVDACVVPHLLKELCRVKEITDRVANLSSDVSPERRESEEFHAVCELNNLTGLCPDGVKYRDALIACDKISCLNYVNTPLNSLGSNDNPALNELYRYVGVDEYDAYHNGCVLTLVRKSLHLCPEAKEIPCVDSLALFFEFDNRRFINVNVSLGGLALDAEGKACKKSKINAIVCWLQQYKDCGSFLLSGAMGDLDYDLDQLLYRGDAKIPEFAQLMTTMNLENASAPSGFPCDPEDPVYQLLEYLLKTCNAEHIPYSWLLQYLRVNGYKDCCASSMVHGKKSCGPCKTKLHTPKEACEQAIYDRRKGPSPKHHVPPHARRAHAKSSPHKADKCAPKKACCGSCAKGKKCEDKPGCEDRCEPGNLKCYDTCKCVCKDKCKVPLKHKCEEKKEECKCYEKKDCHCCDTKYTVKPEVCEDPCKKSCKGGCKDHCNKQCKPCKKECNPCKKNCKDVCDCPPCPEKECPPYWDSLSVLKRELHLWNTLEKIEDANNRYTGYYDHFNRCLDCRYPRGIFQAWAMCEDYCLPEHPSRVVDNNSELLALDHILVSDCVKNYVGCSTLSDLKLSTDISSLPNALSKLPFSACNADAEKLLRGPNERVDTSSHSVPDYCGVCVESFFPNRVYCTELRFPCEPGCNDTCGLDLEALGVKALWCALDRWGTCEVDFETMKSFCLDKHPFFEKFFYNTLTNRKFMDKDMQGRYDRAFSVCRENDVAYRVRKADKITECEFYDVLTCAFSNIDSRDRFVITMGYMEAVVRAIRDGKSAELNSDIGCTKLEYLWDFLDQCFSGEIKLRDYLNSYANVICDPELVVANIGGTNLNDPDSLKSPEAVVASIIDDLQPCLANNCRVMEVLIRNASKSMETLFDNANAPVDISCTQQVIFDVNDTAGNWATDVTVDDVVSKLPPSVCPADSVRALLDDCVAADKLVDFLMCLTLLTPEDVEATKV